MVKVKEGQPAPDFSLASTTAGQVALKELRGKEVVLFFYPKDDTPGCTKESCEFRDLTADFERTNALVFGISADDVESHNAFAKKYDLNFPLLADTDRKVCEAYGVWGEQEWQGKKFMGIARTTFVIDEEGVLKKIYEKVNPVGHAAAVLQDVQK